MSKFDVLSELKPYFDDSVRQDDEQKLDELFGLFQRDFFDNPFSLNGIPIKVKIHPYTKQRRDGLPEFYGKYYEKFVHVITRESKGKTKISPKQRQLEPQRCNRIHWIKPILENHTDSRITVFKYKEENGIIRDYYWFREKKYMVILEFVRPDFILITGFCVDRKNYNYYENKYNRREAT
jgi:hypothetical protein